MGERLLKGLNYIYMAHFLKLSGRDRVFYCQLFIYFHVLNILYFKQNITSLIKLTVLLKYLFIYDYFNHEYIFHFCMRALPCLTLQPHGLQSSRLLCPWDFPDKNTNTRVGSHFLPQGILLTQGLNSRLLCCRQILYHQAPEGALDNVIMYSLSCI